MSAPNENTGKQAGGKRRQKNSSEHDYIPSVAGKGEGVTTVVGGVVDGRRLGESGAEDQKSAEQKRQHRGRDPMGGVNGDPILEGEGFGVHGLCLRCGQMTESSPLRLYRPAGIPRPAGSR